MASNPRDPVKEYAEAVVSGKEIAGPHVRAACQRHLDDLEHGHERGLWFDYEAAQRALDFFPDILRLNGGQFEGIPFNLHWEPLWLEDEVRRSPLSGGVCRRGEGEWKESEGRWHWSLYDAG